MKNREDLKDLKMLLYGAFNSSVSDFRVSTKVVDRQRCPCREAQLARRKHTCIPFKTQLKDVFYIFGTKNSAFDSGQKNKD